MKVFLYFLKTGVLAVTSCEYGCADDNMTWVKKPFTTTSTTSTIRPMYITNVTVSLYLAKYCNNC